MNQKQAQSQSGIRPGRDRRSGGGGGPVARVSRLRSKMAKDTKKHNCGDSRDASPVKKVNGSVDKDGEDVVGDAPMSEAEKKIVEDAKQQAEEKEMEEEPKMNGEKKEEEVFGLIEKQNDLIQRQKEDIEELKKRLEENVKVTDIFRAELREIRLKVDEKQEHQQHPATNGGVNHDEQKSSWPSSPSETALKAKIDGLSAAYNDIQDRLYEIDKSWKNNLVVYGIPARRAWTRTRR